MTCKRERQPLTTKGVIPTKLTIDDGIASRIHPLTLTLFSHKEGKLIGWGAWL